MGTGCWTCCCGRDMAVDTWATGVLRPLVVRVCEPLIGWLELSPAGLAVSLRSREAVWGEMPAVVGSREDCHPLPLASTLMLRVRWSETRLDTNMCWW